MSKFQVILLCAFGFFIFMAVLVFSFYRGGNSAINATITVWGELPAEDFRTILSSKISQLDKSLSVNYIEKSPETIGQEFTEALASGGGPDLVVMSHEKLFENKSKLMLIPYSSFSERDFREMFAEQADLLLSAEGIYGFPLLIDPLVLYYNRDLLSSVGEARPLEYWDEIYAQALKISQRDQAGNLVRSVMALGETRNIPNFKKILALLFMQAGTPITSFSGGELRSALTYNPGLPTAPAQAGLDFYTQFANPSRAYYGWNRALPDAQTHFTSGDSAYYLGLSSEFSALRNKNPNLNFGLASVPQSRAAGGSLTYGDLYAVFLSRGTKNAPASLKAAFIMASTEIVSALSQSSGLPPARRDLLSEKPTDSTGPILYEAAIQSRGWVDPAPRESQSVFAEMVESVTSGRSRAQQAVSSANSKLNELTK